MEGLYQVIVSPTIQGIYLIVCGIQCAQYEDRGLVPSVTDQFRELYAVYPRQHDVHKDDIPLLLIDVCSGHLGRGGQGYRVAGFFQTLDYKITDAAVIFYEQDRHAAED